jgi:outer membrane protein OmpA-like peptidoglycan-associated protein
MNILSLIQNQLSPEAISKLSNTVGESPESTKTALGAAVPAILGSLLGKANASPDGATQIFNTLQQGQGSWMNSISSMLSGGGNAAQAQSGTGNLLNSLLGSKLGPVAEFISGHAGIRSNSAMSILGMAAPLVMGTLGKQVAPGGLGAAGLGQLLNSQAGFLKDAMPAGLANTLGLGSLLSGAHDTTRVPTDTTRTASVSPGVPMASMAPKRTGSALKWAVPLLAIGALALWALSNNSETAPAVGGSADIPQTQAGRDSGKPDLSSLNLPTGSTADRIAKAIPNGYWNQKFDLSNLNFDSSGNLTDSAKPELQQIGSVLKAVPNLKAAITGFGPTTEEGLAKANSIKSVFTSGGISTDRILARGETGAGVPSLRLIK